MKEKKIRFCGYCDKKFIAEEAVDKWYCSQECSQKADIQEEYETYEKEEIKCPHCEEIYSDDLDKEYQAGGDIFECPNCGEEFILSAYTSTSFTAIPTKEQIDKIYEERNDRPL